VVFLTDKIPFINLYPRKPLIYNVLIKSVVFSIAAVIFFILEEILRLGIHARSLSEGFDMMAADMNWPAFCLRQMWLFVLILFYCAAVELVRVLGPDKVRNIFLRDQK
jgi:hypothetical protein